MIVSPRKTTRIILKQNNIYSALGVVLGTSSILGILFLISYVKHDYPPDAQTLHLWIKAWGTFGILPFLKIAPESYRLFLSIAITPLLFAIWMLMAGSAKFLSIIFHGKVSFKQYLNLFGFSFFAFFILQTLLDIVFSNLMWDFEISALKMSYGMLVAKIVVWFPMIVYPIVLAMGGIYNGIVTQEVEKYSWWKTMLVCVVTSFWPIVLISTLIR